jgi:hypothetical protein
MMIAEAKWSEHDPDGVIWKSPYSRGFYRIVESLMHSEYDLSLEFTLQKYVKSKVLRSVLGGMRIFGDGKERVAKYRDPRFFGWRGQRTPEKAERHRVGHQIKAERERQKKAQRLRVLS